MDTHFPSLYLFFCSRGSSCGRLPAPTPTGSGGLKLNPRPRNFTDGKYMNARTDAQLINVIKNGGTAEKLSPMMIAFGNQLNDSETKGIVAYIRSLAVPKYQPKQ